MGNPTAVTKIQAFLGLANYHRAFIPNFSTLSAPLNALLGKKVKFHWGPIEQQAFEQLKTALLSPAVLAIPSQEGEFILDTDASDTAIGGSLHQVQNGVERVVAYGSYALDKCQKKYCVTRRELLAVVKFCHHFRHYLLGRHFRVRTDHVSLIWLANFHHPQGQLARWLEVLAQYTMTIEHRPGRLHGNADGLSRRPPSVLSGPETDLSLAETLAQLPCRGCSYCQKARSKGSFEEELDDVTHLTGTTIRQVAQRQNAVDGITIDLSDDQGGVEMPWSKDRLVQEQQKEPEFSLLLSKLLGTTPDTPLSLATPVQKYYLAQHKLFYLDENLLFYDNAIQPPQLVIPSSLRNDVLFHGHDIPTAGHLGVFKTKERLRGKYFWHGMTQDVKKYVEGCSTCNKNKGATTYNKHPRAIMQASAPMQRVHIDILGPFPVTARGHEYVLMLSDSFTKWTEGIPIKNQEAETTARAAISEFFSRFGFPLEILTDQGRNFESKLFAEVCRLLHIKKSRTSPYRPSTNGQVERQNRTLVGMLRCFINENQNNWDELLPLLCSALRSSVHRSTGFTPNFLMLGREVYVPTDLLFPLPKKQQSSPSEYVDELREGLEKSHKAVRTKLKADLIKEKRKYDQITKCGDYRRGEVVYYLDFAPSKKCKKLNPAWLGPAVVVAVPSPYTLVLKVKATDTRVMNIEYVKHCKDKTLPTWILREQKAISSGQKVEYCTCRKPDDGLPMVRCDNCFLWCHLACVGLTRRGVERLKTFLCPKCHCN